MDPEQIEDESEQQGDNGGRTMAIAVVIGVVLFAVTNNPVWIALGVALGAGMVAKERSSG